MSDKVDALVIFGATGDLAKIETFPALVGLVKRGVLDVPVVGVAKSGWGLEQFRDYATASLKLNNMDPAEQLGRHLHVVQDLLARADLIGHGLVGGLVAQVAVHVPQQAEHLDRRRVGGIHVVELE